MSDLIGMAYLIIGGVVAGRLVVDMLDVAEDAKDVGCVLLWGAISWIFWPLAWGIQRALEKDRHHD